MEDQSDIVANALGFLDQGWELARGWLLSPAAWSQFGLLLVAFVAAVLITRRLRPFLERVITPPEDQRKHACERASLPADFPAASVTPSGLCANRCG